METIDLVILPATFDGAPFDDVIGRCAEWVAHVRLLKNFFVAGARFAIGEELVGGEFCSARFVDDFDEAVVDGVLDGDFEI